MAPQEVQRVLLLVEAPLCGGWQSEALLLSRQSDVNFEGCDWFRQLPSDDTSSWRKNILAKRIGVERARKIIHLQNTIQGLSSNVDHHHKFANEQRRDLARLRYVVRPQHADWDRPAQFLESVSNFESRAFRECLDRWYLTIHWQDDVGQYNSWYHWLQVWPRWHASKVREKWPIVNIWELTWQRCQQVGLERIWKKQLLAQKLHKDSL